MAGMIYNLVCLLILFSVLLMFATEAVANMMYERWHRVGVFLSKYPKRKKGEGDKRRVLVTDCEGNVGEAQYDFRTYTFSIEKVRAWKNYPEPFRVSKGPVRKIRELWDERLAKKIRKEVKKWHTE